MLTFLRKDVSLGCAAQLSTKRIISLFCAAICASKEWRNEQKISVVIHALPFAWYLVGNFLTFLNYLGFGDFPITIGTCLSLPSLLTHSSTVSLSLECFPPWQDSPLYAKVLSGSTLKNSPVSSALYTCAAWLYYCVAKFIVQREGKAINKYFASIFFFQTIHAGNASSEPWFTNDQCGKTIVRGTMDVGINNVIYMELNSGPKIANSTCGKTIVAGTIDRGSTVL